MGSDMETRIRNVTAVLGPTNTGKTHLAIERMLDNETGLIGLPLRLLAREVYDRVVRRAGADKVALITGEERIKPEEPRYWVSTVEAMPRQIDVDFLAIDEIQLAADPERGHVFTDRLLHARGKLETLVLGAGTMREAISDLIPGANFISRPRLSKITYSGEKKITRLPKRTAIVAFSASEVYAIAELIRRQIGGAAVVLGALSPRTRNAQVALYQSGDVDYLVATDAIGMGLNLAVDHVAFAAVRKFDGQDFRMLTPAELGQIAGRAGRYLNDGTFGVTGDVPGFDSELIDRLENHTFDPVKTLQWRSRKLDFASVDALRDSLREPPREARLQRARMADDVAALESVTGDRELMEAARGHAAVSLLWDVCQVPDYRKISGQSHAELVASLYKFLTGPGARIPEDWFAKQVAFADRTDGDIDTLANRISHIRTWTFVSNRADWLVNPEHWQARTREIEDQLSDALHERLAQRFVDRKTSALMRGLRDKEELSAEIGEDGAVKVESHFVGRLKGFSFSPDPDAQSEGLNAKTSRHATSQVVAKEFAMRARRVAAAKANAFKLNRRGRVLWRDEEIARLEASDDPLRPNVVLIADELLGGQDREKVQERLNAWLGEIVGERLKPLVEISKAEDVTGLARGIAFRLTESFGVLRRDTVAEELRALDQSARAQLRKYGVRFGAFNVYFPLLLKPASADLALVLWTLKFGAGHGLSLDALPEPPRAGLTSTKADPAVPDAFYRACGYHACGPRAVRMDILERLADLIRPMLAWRGPPKSAPASAPAPEAPVSESPRPEEPPAAATEAAIPMPETVVEAPPGDAPAPAVAQPIDAAAPAPPAVTEVAPEGAPAPATPAAAPQPPREPPRGATGDGGFKVIPEMMSILGCSPEETGNVLKVLGFRLERRRIGPPIPAGPALPAEQVATGVAAADPASPSPAADGAPTGDEAGAPAPAEAEQWEEIWRPRRRREREPNRGERSFKGRRPDRAPRPAAGAAAGGENGGQAAAADGPDRGGRDRSRDRSRGDRDRPRDGKDHRDASGEGRRDRRPEHGERRPSGRSHERRDGDRGRRDDRPVPIARYSSAPGKKGGADPDSPFAKLGALKAELEKRREESKS
jgi:ATP-dependent RNA helicase SUPV3L1/SUV3